jgi:hypothetical protein
VNRLVLLAVTLHRPSPGFEKKERYLPSPGIARPNNTPASARTAAGDLDRGGPGRAFRFSKVS